MLKRPPYQRPHAPTPIGKVLNKYVISLRELSECLGREGITTGASRTTLHRMIRGALSPEIQSQIYPKVQTCLKKFLVARGLNGSEIDAELSEVFVPGEYEPMSFQRVRLSRPELTFFGLAEDPFKNDPQSREEVYFPPEYREIFDTIIDAAKYRHFIAVLGPVGSSKSTIQDYVRDHISRETALKIVWPEFYNQANLTPSEIARSILRALGADKIPGRATALSAEVTKQLRYLTESGNRVAIVIDNAHELNKTAIRSLKKFMEMSSGGFQRYLGIILLGWPEFARTLQDSDFAEIYERLHVIPMPPFQPNSDTGTYEAVREISAPMMAGYLEHRFKLVGAKVSDYFDKDAIDYIAGHAVTPLQCGNIANRAMQRMMHEYEEPKVRGAAIRTKMYFDTAKAPAFKKR